MEQNQDVEKKIAEAMKAALAMAPKSETMKYEVKGNFDKDTKFMLKRTK